jgi:hypothetical protein
MIHAVIYSGAEILLTGWNSPTLRIIFLAEIIFLVLGILFGVISTPKRTTISVLISVCIIGLLFILKNLLWGVSSDTFILIPFIGEILFISSGISLLIIFLKKSRI